MSATNGSHRNGHRPADPARSAVSAARPVVLLRTRPTAPGEPVGRVHLVPLPDSSAPKPGVLVAACGARLCPEQVEQVRPGEAGVPCTGCVLTQTITSGSVEDTGAQNAPEHTAAGQWDPQAGPHAAAVCYRQWGWPVTLRRDQVWLSLRGTAVALVVPASLAAQAVPILVQRHCPPLVIAHPATPDHRVLLGAEPYPVRLGYPTGVCRVSTRVLLPPTVTDHGPLSWAHPPRPDALRLTREIDLCSAIRTVPHGPAADSPTVTESGDGRSG